MYSQKKKETIKEYEKQEKRLKEMKQQGQSKKQAVSFPITGIDCCSEPISNNNIV